MTKPHEYYMSQALKLAREAADAGEVPVGCVIVRDGAVIGRGRNRREEKQAVCSHAEMEAMAQANAALGSWRLDNCALYAGAVPHVRRGHHQQPHPAGGIRRGRHQGGLLRQCD